MSTWGVVTINATGSIGTWRTFHGGISAAGTNQLDSISVVTGGAANGRLAVYTGGTSINDLTGATLLEDLGELSTVGAETVIINSLSNPILPDSGLIWLVIKSNTGAFDRLNSLPADDVTSVLRVFDNSAESVGFAATETNAGGAITVATSLTIEYSAIVSLKIDSVDVDNSITLGQQNVDVELLNAPNTITSVTLNGITQVINSQTPGVADARTVNINVTGYIPDGVQTLVVSE